MAISRLISEIRVRRNKGHKAMLTTPRDDNLNKIVILNPKGGCGKSTLVTNLAARYAQDGPIPAVMDFDPQGSTISRLAR